MGMLKDAFGRLFGASADTDGEKTAAARGKATAAAKNAPVPSPKKKKAATPSKTGAQTGAAPSAGSAARDKALAQVRAAQGTVVTTDRAELIRQAMQIRKAKQQILADLSDDQRAKLAALAIRGLLNEGRDEPRN